MSGEHVVINPLLAAIKKEEERKKVKEAERMRRRALRAERRRARATGSGSHRSAKRNSSQLPLPIPTYEEIAKTSMGRTNSDDSLLKAKLAAAGRMSQAQPAAPGSTRTRRRTADVPRNGENGPVAGPRTHKHTKDTKGGREHADRKGDSSDNSSSYEDKEEEEEVDREKLSDSGERWAHLREETGFYYLDGGALNTLEKWLQDLRLPTDEYLKLFLSQGFDNLQTIALLTEEDIAQLGITKIGHRKKILFWAQNNRPPHYEDLMTLPDLCDDDEDIVAITNFTSWIDYGSNSNSNNAVPVSGRSPTSPSSLPVPSPRPTTSNPTSPTASPITNSPSSPKAYGHVNSPTAKPKPKPAKDK